MTVSSPDDIKPIEIDSDLDLNQTSLNDFNCKPFKCRDIYNKYLKRRKSTSKITKKKIKTFCSLCQKFVLNMVKHKSRHTVNNNVFKQRTNVLINDLYFNNREGRVNNNLMIFSPPKNQPPKTQLSKVGTWQNFSNGIGAKLLLKMGYEDGKGLGKHLQGILSPIETKQRTGIKKLGLGAVDTKLTRKKKKAAQKTNFYQFTQKLKEWKNNQKITSTKPDSLEEIIKSLLDKQVELNFDGISNKIQIQSLDTCIELLTSLKDSTISDDSKLINFEMVFIELQSNYHSIYLSLMNFAPTILSPFFIKKLNEINLLREPFELIPLFKKWKNILRGQKSTTSIEVEPFSRLMTTIVPIFRATSVMWNPLNHQEMIQLLEIWYEILPNWIFNDILNDQILPKLYSSADKWNPLDDEIPINLWILPWKKYLKSNLEKHVYPMILHKFSLILQSWTLKNHNALQFVTLWRKEIPDKDIENFLTKHIIPKLKIFLSNFVVKPTRKTDLIRFNEFWEWNTIISPEAMADMLEKYFFPKWTSALRQWLKERPTLEQLSSWYNGWKHVLSDEVLQVPVIKKRFHNAHALMNRTIPVSSNLPQLNDTPTEYYELVLRTCGELGISFVSMPGRKENGKQIYLIGRIFCYFNKTIIWCSDRKCLDWSIITLSELLEKCFIN